MRRYLLFLVLRAVKPDFEAKLLDLEIIRMSHDGAVFKLTCPSIALQGCISVSSG